MAFHKPLSFSRLLMECQTLFDHFVFVQLLQDKSKVSKTFLKHLAIYAGKDTVKQAAKLALKRAYHRAGIDVDVVYDSPKLYCCVQSFTTVINAHPKDFNPLLMACMFS